MASLGTSDAALADQAAAVRASNRFYTNVMGLANGTYLDMPYSLTGARLLFEMGWRDITEVADLRQAIHPRSVHPRCAGERLPDLPGGRVHAGQRGT